MLHHKRITEDIFERASLSLGQLDDSNLQIQVTELFIHLGKVDSTWNSLVFQQIRSYSLLEFDSQNQSYSMHPLVQHWSASTSGNHLPHPTQGEYSPLKDCPRRGVIPGGPPLSPGNFHFGGVGTCQISL